MSLIGFWCQMSIVDVKELVWNGLGVVIAIRKFSIQKNQNISRRIEFAGQKILVGVGLRKRRTSLGNLNDFNDVFQTIAPSVQNLFRVIHHIGSSVLEEMRQQLDSPFPREEVKKALFGMGPTKAPVPDGFHSLFFQKNWELVGNDLITVCLGS